MNFLASVLRLRCRGCRSALLCTESSVCVALYVRSSSTIQRYENFTNIPRESSAKNADEKKENDGYGREYKDDFTVVLIERTNNKRVVVLYIAR